MSGGRKRRQREEPCHICNHFHDYEGGEPCGICGHTLNSSASTAAITAANAAAAAAAAASAAAAAGATMGGGGGFSGAGPSGVGAVVDPAAAAAAAAAAQAAQAAATARAYAAEDAMPRASARPGEVDSGVFFGSYDNAARSEVLRALQITHILNTVPTCNELYKTSFVYYTTPAIPPDLRACCEFILRARSGFPGGGNVVGGLGSDVGGLPAGYGGQVEQQRQQQQQLLQGNGLHLGGLGAGGVGAFGGEGQPPLAPGRVLIHDMTGSTRAPLVAAAWLVAAHGVSPQAALTACAARRVGVSPRAGDVQVLADFARELRDSPGGGAEFVEAGQRQRQMQMQQQMQMQMQGGAGGMMMAAGQQQQQQQQNIFQQ